MELLLLLSVTGLNLWGVLVATGAVCIIYCTLVGTACVKRTLLYLNDLSGIKKYRKCA